ncbi:unnamed protein product [Cylindrotheca closterium]|uniref:Uncharacterized protein n=1 Tax=Cylindrotheca closterium TaxID=2856 RepID=A0AAD2PWL0_9STRA|nr:unnamed protein product [Cylindrotheca closterium]
MRVRCFSSFVWEPLESPIIYLQCEKVAREDLDSASWFQDISAVGPTMCRLSVRGAHHALIQQKPIQEHLVSLFCIFKNYHKVREHGGQQENSSRILWENCLRLKQAFCNVTINGKAIAALSILFEPILGHGQRTNWVPVFLEATIARSKEI